MAEIHEESNISSSQYAQFFPKQKYNIPKSTVQKVKSVITSLNSGIVSNTFNGTASTPYDFVINANNLSVFDLSQCYFNIAGTIKISDTLKMKSSQICLGNLFISSLFQNASLSLGGETIAMNNYPGSDANAQAALKFDAYDLKNFTLADREFMIPNIDFDLDATPNVPFTFVAGDFVFKDLKREATTAHGVSAAGKAYPVYKNLTLIYVGEGKNLSAKVQGATNFTITFNDSGEATIDVFKCTAIDANTENDASTFTGPFNYLLLSTDDSIVNAEKNSVIPPLKTGIEGEIPFRCKLYLSDLFNYTVDSLDYVFNREIKITLTRSATNFIIANIAAETVNQNVVANVIKTTKFELVAFSYLLTDTARTQLLKFYSQPVETLYGVQTINMTPFYNMDTGTEQQITLPLTVNYDTKAILLAIPKCATSLMPLSTNPGQISQAGDATLNKFKISWYMSNSNSYNFGGLRYIRISNTSNSNIYTYDFQGTEENYKHGTTFIKSFDYSNSDETVDAKILDYREAYAQFKELRLLFGKSPDNAIDYYTYLKDYCIIPVDLTGSNIPPNTRIMVNLQFASWANDFNPLCFGNIGRNNKVSTNIMAIFLGRDVLQYLPDGTCKVKHVLTANPVEKEYNVTK